MILRYNESNRHPHRTAVHAYAGTVGEPNMENTNAYRVRISPPLLVRCTVKVSNANQDFLALRLLLFYLLPIALPIQSPAKDIIGLDMDISYPLRGFVPYPNSIATASLLVLKAYTAWVLLQLLVTAFNPGVRSLKTIASFIRSVTDHVLNTCLAFGALFVLLPSFAFVVLEVLGHIRTKTRSNPSKSLSGFVAQVACMINELESVGTGMRQSTASLNMATEETLVRNSVRLFWKTLRM
jgi:hypothetical protein